ncbi:MAG: Bp26: periplasmic immunogenic protein [Thermoanaerobacterales bacterium 50_218]|nr:MAG: Bp26: periplasmic immunogenic protein [Thermoanaerobacterales bacterium 50_218]HAA90170.1 hypothetical protein [Peptococcaceae bacterium]
MRKLPRAGFILLLAILFVGGILAGGILMGAPETAVAESEQQQIVVTGTGQVNVQPDQAVVTLGVLSIAETAKDAQKQNAVVVNKVINALLKAGVPEKKIETRNYSIWPEYNYPKPEEKRAPTIIAYRVNNTIVVTLDDPEKTGEIIDAAVSAGANKVESISFTKKDLQSAQQEALKQACRNARMKAEAIAEGLGVTITGIASVREGGNSVITSQEKSFLAGSGAPTPIQPGELQVSASVTVAFNIK